VALEFRSAVGYRFGTNTVPIAGAQHFMTSGFRPEIAGLRAIAVVSVVLFHQSMGYWRVSRPNGRTRSR
jgi:hypothetical protein